jgi:hypothetical protein
MKRKIISVIALALILIGIAYVRALFSHQAREGTFSQEVTRIVPPEILENYLKKEEAARAYDSLEQFYTDSLEHLTVYWSDLADSLPRTAVDSLKQLIDKLQQDLETTKENVRKAKRGKTEQFEKLIAAFYKGELSQLPADLTKYEQDVSIKEIKSKAQDYFGISSEKLNKIIKNIR